MKAFFSLMTFVIILAIAGVFIFQNTAPIDVYVYKWSANIPAGVFMLGTLLAGILLGALWFLPRVVYRDYQIRSLRSKLEKLEKGLTETQENLDWNNETVNILRDKNTENEKKEIIMKEFLPK